MRDLLSFVRRVAVSEAGSILIEGENGTGKDLIAKTLALSEPAPGGAIPGDQLRGHP
jgi:transcriptional regulator with GAF, ATPase, and Fis domain